jgi:hypothetical protein
VHYFSFHHVTYWLTHALENYIDFFPTAWNCELYLAREGCSIYPLKSIEVGHPCVTSGAGGMCKCLQCTQLCCHSVRYTSVRHSYLSVGDQYAHTLHFWIHSKILFTHLKCTIPLSWIPIQFFSFQTRVLYNVCSVQYMYRRFILTFRRTVNCDTIQISIPQL